MAITPEEFAAGAQQLLGREPIKRAPKSQPSNLRAPPDPPIYWEIDGGRLSLWIGANPFSSPHGPRFDDTLLLIGWAGRLQPGSTSMVAIARFDGEYGLLNLLKAAKQGGQRAILVLSSGDPTFNYFLGAETGIAGRYRVRLTRHHETKTPSGKQKLNSVGLFPFDYIDVPGEDFDRLCAKVGVNAP